jgi:glucokinase
MLMSSGGKSTTMVLVADIGGTNARLAVATVPEDGSAPEISNFKAFPCSEFSSLEDVLSLYLSSLSGPKPQHACLAVAGPVIGKTAHLTNLGWHIDADKFADQFGFSQLHLVNDFAAVARSTTALDSEDLVTLRDQKAEPLGPVSVMGPGTGFGLALLVKHKSGCTIVSAEGGHVAFVPHGELETKVWTALQENLGRVTVETLLSGVGIMRIYRELCHIHGNTPLNYDARTISNQALDHGDETCLETLSVFCSMLGSVAGDVSLSHGSTGGVYLAGGILPKIKEFFLKSHFVERFLEKPPMEDFVRKIPVHLITAPDAALKGAALLYLEKIEHEPAH